jgi:hypothetical protein
MKAQSKVYIQLQGIYKAKARKDAAEILQIAQAAPGGERVDPAEVDLFCKNAAFVKLINATGAQISRADRLKSAAGKQSPSRSARSTMTVSASQADIPHRDPPPQQEKRRGGGYEAGVGERNEARHTFVGK